MKLRWLVLFVAAEYLFGVVDFASCFVLSAVTSIVVVIGIYFGTPVFFVVWLGSVVGALSLAEVDLAPRCACIIEAAEDVDEALFAVAGTVVVGTFVAAGAVVAAGVVAEARTLLVYRHLALISAIVGSVGLTFRVRT